MRKPALLLAIAVLALLLLACAGGAWDSWDGLDRDGWDIAGEWAQTGTPGVWPTETPAPVNEK